MRTDFAAVILAAGLGTRMKSRDAKVLHRAGGKTLIERVACTAVRLVPPDRVFVVVGYQSDLVRRIVAPLGVGFIPQPEQLGTGHAVLVGRETLAGAAPHVLVLYGDAPLVQPETLASLMDRHLEARAAATVLTTRLPDPHGYGRIVRNAAGDVAAIVEEKAATAEQRQITEINSGIYCFRAPLLFERLAGLRPDNPAKEYYLTDVIETMVRRGERIASVTIPESWQVLGINTRAELAEVDSFLRNRKARELMLEGVTIQRPETVTIDPDVVIGPDTTLEPFSQVLGRSRIGSGCLIRSYSIVSDATLADDVVIEHHSLVNNSKVERRVRIGPYARLRTDNAVGAEAHVGNFVELKNTRLGARSKAMHLAYLGDSTIGEDVNIGAGTITCNFDGVGKHQTKIEDGAFVGSNSTLVAPVEVGKGAYLAAGSVITENVPGDALAIARGRQTVKPGWASARKRKKKKN